MVDPKVRKETRQSRTHGSGGCHTPGVGTEAAPTEKEEELSRAVRLCPNQSDLQLLPSGQQPADPAAGGNHLHERKGVGLL